MTRITKHLPHYVPLAAIILAGVFGFLIFSYDQAFQIMILVAVSVSYVLWGVIHHKIHDDLSLFVIIEYLVIATLGLVVVLSLLFRA
jgi:hypothetical protein